MTLWIDADGFPRRQREIALAAARRKGISAVVVSDRPIEGISGETVSFVSVEAGDDSSDRYIESCIAEGDLVLTRDIPSMERIIRQGGTCMDHAGQLYDRSTIRERLSLRSFMEHYREAYGSPRKRKTQGRQEVEGFANSLDRLLEEIQ